MHLGSCSLGQHCESRCTRCALHTVSEGKSITEVPFKSATPEQLRESSPGGRRPGGLGMALNTITLYNGPSKGMGRDSSMDMGIDLGFPEGDICGSRASTHTE